MRHILTQMPNTHFALLDNKPHTTKAYADVLRKDVSVSRW